MAVNEMTPEAFEQVAKDFVGRHHNLNLATFFVATAVDTILCGVMFIQLIEYFTYSKDDRKFNKIIVILTAISSTAVTVYITVCMFELFVYNFGEYTPFASTTILSYMSLLDIIPSTATQIFFTHRAYKLSNHSKILVGAIGAFILVSVTGAIGFVPVFMSLNGVPEVTQIRVKLFMYLWLAGGLGADVLITWTIMIRLVKSRTGWRSTDRTITKLMRVVVETQLPPTVVILVFFITFGALTDTYLDIWPQWVQSKFYTCGLLASLNSRYSLRRAAQDSSSHGKAKANQAVVHVLTETFVQRDEVITLPSAGKKDIKAPYFASNNTFSSRRQPAKDPLELEMDDDSIELEEAGVPTHTLRRETTGTGTETDDDHEGGHKMDYLENGSKTGLTEGTTSTGRRRD